MRLRTKTLLLIGVTLVGLVGVLYTAASTILSGSVTQAEVLNTRQTVRGMLSLFEQVEDDLSNRLENWAAWDETYRFMADENLRYRQSNLIPEAIATLKLNLILYVNPSGQTVFGSGFDLKHRQFTPISPEIQKHLTANDLLVQQATPNSHLSGLLLLPEGPMLIAAQPILTSRKKGPSQGTLIFGRYLDADEISRLSKITRTRFSLYPLDSPSLPAEIQAVVSNLRPLWKTRLESQRNSSSSNVLPSNLIVVQSLNESTIAGYTLLNDIYGKPILILRTDIYRGIYQQSRKSLHYLIVSIWFVGLVFSGITLLLVERLVLSRLAKLSTDVKRIGIKGDLSLRVFSRGSDELSGLANTINKMLTALEQSQDKLQESEGRHRSVIEQVAEGIFLFDVQTNRILDANTAFRHLLGYTEKEISKLTIYDFLTQEMEEVNCKIDQVLKQKYASLGELRYRRQDGSFVDVLVNLSLISYGNREVVCAVVHDITERKRVEEALRQAEAKYRQIFENATEGIFQSTPDGRFLSANPALARIYGYSSVEELISHLTNIEQQLYVDLKRRARFLTSLQKHGSVSKFVSQVYQKNCKVIWISENVRAVRDVDGNLLYYEGTVEDITERKITEEALRYQQEQAERLLLNILPGPIAARLKLEENTIADSYTEVTVLFADIVGFTKLSTEIPPTELVALLNKIFSKFDNLAEKYELEKIKTIGDSYMVVGGLPIPRDDHAEAIAAMALEMQQAMTQFKTANGTTFRMRIGINTGPVVAGVIGIKRFIYDLWGDTVNTASRMESHGIAGSIQVTSSTYERLKDRYILNERGLIQVKGKGEMLTYLLIGEKVAVAAKTPS